MAADDDLKIVLPEGDWRIVLTEETKAKIKEHFLIALERGYTTGGALKVIGDPVNYKTILDWRRHDKDFADDWIIARERGTDLIEDAGMRRAVHGVPEPVVSGGKLVYVLDEATGKLVPLTVQKYSDGLWKEVMKSRRDSYARTEMQGMSQMDPTLIPDAHHDHENTDEEAPAEVIR